MTALALILLLSFLVIIHELGHLFAAFWAKIKVEEFGLGYPPKAKTFFTWRGVPFTLNWVPFGGFVRMAGEEDTPEEASKHERGHFYTAPIGKRLVVILAGATVNFLFGVIAFAAIFSFMGIPRQLEEARVGYVMPESPAAKAGLPVNVTITSLVLNETEVAVHSPAEVIEFVKKNRGATVTVRTTGICEALSCEKKVQEFSTYIRTEAETPTGEGALGIAFQDYTLEFYPWYEMPFRGTAFGITQALGLGGQILSALRGLVSDVFTKGVVPSELAGPVGIVHQAQSAGLLNQGWLAVVSFAGMLSINLAIMNVLPIPPLDGGKALFTILEPIVSRKRLQHFEYWVNYAGYIFLLGLILVVTVRDVARIIF